MLENERKCAVRTLRRKKLSRAELKEKAKTEPDVAKEYQKLNELAKTDEAAVQQLVAIRAYHRWATVKSYQKMKCLQLYQKKLRKEENLFQNMKKQEDKI